jgi:hypothetical protein
MNEFDLPAVKKGDRLSAKQQNILRRLVRRRITGPNVIETGDGWHVRREVQAPHPIMLRNASGETAPAYGVAEVTDVLDEGQTIQIDKPSANDVENTVLVGDQDIPNGGEGEGWEEGTHRILYDGAPSAGDRLGSQTNSWNAAVFSGGNYLCRAVGGGAAYAFFMPTKLNRYFIDEHCYIDSSNPGNNFGHPDLAQIHFTTATPDDTIHIGLFKFAEQLPPSFGYAITWLVVLSTVNEGIYFRTPVYTLGDLRGYWRLWVIREDFDASTITYNDWAGLSKLDVDIENWELNDVRIDISSRQWCAPAYPGYHPRGGLVYYNSGAYGSTFAGSYGLAVEPCITTSNPPDSWVMYLKVHRQKFTQMADYSAFAEIFRT